MVQHYFYAEHFCLKIYKENCWNSNFIKWNQTTATINGLQIVHILCCNDSVRGKKVNTNMYVFILIKIENVYKIMEYDLPENTSIVCV